MIRPRVLLAQLPHLLIYIENVNELVAVKHESVLQYGNIMPISYYLQPELQIAHIFEN